MRLARVRVGERFVFANIGGVYIKKSSDTAKCIYGRAKGRIMLLNPEESVYAIFDGDSEERHLKKTLSKSEKEPSVFPDVDEGVTLEIVCPDIEDEDKTLCEIKGVSAALVAGYSNAEMVRVAGKVRRIREIGVDHDKRKIVVEVDDSDEEDA